MTRLIIAALGFPITVDIASFAMKVNADNPMAVKLIGNAAIPVLAAFMVLLINEFHKIYKNEINESDE